MWQCDKTVEEMQRHFEQRLPEKETTGAEDEDSDSDSVPEQEAEGEVTNPQVTQQDISDEGIMSVLFTCIAQGLLMIQNLLLRKERKRQMFVAGKNQLSE